MRLRTTLFLLGATLALLGYIVFHERHQDNSKEALEDRSRVNDFDPEEANLIRLEGPKGKSMFRRGKDGVWMMAHPVEDRADQDLLSSLVTQAADMTIIETMTLGEMQGEGSKGAAKPEDVGFGEKEIRIEILRGDDRLAHFIVGAATEFEDVHYVANEGEWSEEKPVLAVLSRLFETASLAPEKLRDPRLIPARAADLRQIKFAENPTGLMLKRERLADGGSETDESRAADAPPTTPWRLTQPIDTRADEKIVDERIAALLGASIVEFMDDAPAPAATGEVREGDREIRVWTFSGKSKTIIELSDSPEAEAGDFLIARVTDRPGSLRISRDILKAFTVNPNELRDSHLADIRFETVLTIDLQGLAPDGTAEPPVQLERHGANFAVIRRGQKEKADANNVKEMIKALNSEKVVFVADANPNPVEFGLDRPLRIMKIVTETPDPAAPEPPAGQLPAMVRAEYVLSIGEGVKPVPTALGKLFASFKDTPFVYGISPEILRHLEPQAIRWKSPELLRFSLFDLKGITIRRPPQPPLDIAYDPSTNGWIANAAGTDVSASLNVPKVRAFGEAMSFLQCTDWTAEPARALERVREETILDITVRIQDRAANKTDEVRLRVAPTSPGLNRSATYYGQLNDIPDAFLLSRETFNTLNANLVKQPEAPARDAEDVPTPPADPIPAPPAETPPPPNP